MDDAALQAGRLGIVVELAGTTYTLTGREGATVAILAEDVADAVGSGDAPRYEAELRTLDRTVQTLGHIADGDLEADIVLPPVGTELSAARDVVRVLAGGHHIASSLTLSLLSDPDPYEEPGAEE